MELLKTIEYPDEKGDVSKYRKRHASRAIVIKDDKIALLFVSKIGYYKLPGGGIKKGESIEEALHREVKEETGCEIEIFKEVGKTLEIRHLWKILQTSFCFIARVSKIREPDFTKKEKEDGFKLVWKTLDEAIALVGANKSKDYQGGFVNQRDILFLKKAKELI